MQHESTRAEATPLIDTEVTDEAAHWLDKVASRIIFSRRPKVLAKRIPPSVPQISQIRRDGTLNETALDARTLDARAIAEAEEKGKTVLYLAYGSNLTAETFQGVRKIKPLSQMNVVVPQLRLTFDLAGIPYAEPCFANSAVRVPSSASEHSRGAPSYHKDRWHKGMVGVVYEVTATDYAHIIATEGGGASYHDVLVDCYPLESGVDVVPDVPVTPFFKAHTLFAPADATAEIGQCTKPDVNSRITRPDSAYAQPSLRYLTLIRNGATEHDLPHDYKEYLAGIRPYTITTRRQAMGKTIFGGFWYPIIMLMFSISKMLQDDRGRVPKWFAAVMVTVFKTVWVTYDYMVKPVFGDGERTEGDEADSTSRLDCIASGKS